MKTTKTLSILLILVNTVSFADDVKLYNKPPSAAEMGAILFAQTDKPLARARSISFAKTAPAIVTPAQIETASQQNNNSIGLPIEFAYNSAELAPQSEKYIEEIGKMLSMEQYKNEKLRIEGHTDAKGSDTYNKYLSEKRAETVKNYLVKHYGIEMSRLNAEGLGESQALPGVDPYAPVNRRVQLFKGS